MRMQNPIVNVKKAVAPMNRNSKVRSPQRRFIISMVAAVVGTAVVGVAVSVVGMYVGHWESTVIKYVAKVVPAPALAVNGHWRSYDEYLDAVATLDYSFGQPAVLQASGYTVKPSDQELRTMVLDRMAKEEVVNQIAKKRGVAVTKADLDAEMKKLADQTGSEADVAEQVKQLYQWDLTTFSKKVIEPYLLRQRLQDDIASDAAINADAASRAQKALTRVQAGEDFQTIAKELNEDSTKGVSGDMGIWAKGEKDAALEEAAFALEVGKNSGIITTVGGYYILKLLEKVPADDSTSTPEKVHTAGIFIGVKALDIWLYEQSKSQKVAIFLRGYAWNKDGARVVYSGTSSSPATNANSAVNANTNAAVSQ